jgi:hypothetical protein
MLLIAGPYLIYRTIEDTRTLDAALSQTIADRSAAATERRVAEAKLKHLPLVALSQVAVLFVAQVGMAGLSALLIRNHRRRLRSNR